MKQPNVIRALNSSLDYFGGVPQRVKFDNMRQAVSKNRFISEEKPLLQTLPKSSFEIKHVAKAKVQKNYHITLGEDWHFYSVPFNYIGKQVTAIYDADTVEIYYNQNRIALHKRSFKRHGYNTIEEHMPESHQMYHEQQGWTAEYFLA